MKRTCLLITCLLAVATYLMADNDRITRDVSELPVESRRFISAYFAQVDISHIKIEKNLLGIKNYDVILTDGTNIEFDRSGEWTDIDRNNASIPAALVPSDIASYVAANFAGKQIVSIEKEIRGYSVKLDNGIELTFNTNGRLVEIDD